jgi:hypothetical protein
MTSDPLVPKPQKWVLQPSQNKAKIADKTVTADISHNKLRRTVQVCTLTTPGTIEAAALAVLRKKSLGPSEQTPQSA